MSDWVVELPPAAAARARTRIPSEAQAREAAGENLRALRERAGYDEEGLAKAWNDWLGVQAITPDLIRAWEQPRGPMPPWHWAITLWAALLPEALEFSSRLLSLATP